MINPQAPNAATGTSLRVCWGLFSDDTVECYQLCYKPVSSERHSDEQAGKEAWTQGDTSAPHWQKQLVPRCLWTWLWQLVHLLCTLSATKTVISATTFPASGFVALPLPGLPSCWLQQDPSQEQRQDRTAAGVAGMGRGQWMESGLNSSTSFPGGWALH